MPVQKFDENDRAKVVSELERHFSVELSSTGGYSKFLRDSDGRSFWVFGGYGDWHGFQGEILCEGQSHTDDGVLVIAKRHRTTIDVYTGPLQPLIDSHRSLHRTRNGDYHFHIQVHRSNLYIKEVSELVLRKLAAPLEVGPVIRASAARRKLEMLISGLSAEEKNRLIAQFSS